MSYITASTDYVINNTNNKIEFTELTRVFEEHYEMELQEGSVNKYLNVQIWQSPVGFSVDQNYHIMELVHEWFPTVKFRRADKMFRTESAYEKELMAALPLTGHALYKA